MKFLLKTVLVMLLSVGLVLLMLNDPGMVYVAVGDVEIETALSLAVLILLGLFLVLSVVFKFVAKLWSMSDHLQKWQQQRRVVLGISTQQKAMLELSQGHWKVAEREFVKHLKYTDAPLLAYLNAARAAQQQSAIERRDSYLQLAHEYSPQSELSIGITQAELHISQQQLEQALAILTSLQTLEPKNTYILQLLLRLYQDLNDWYQLSKLLPSLRKNQVLNVEEFAELEHKVYSNLLQQTAATADGIDITAIWSETPKSLKDDVRIIALYAEQMIANKQGEAIEPLLRGFLKKRWDENIVYLYSTIEIEPLTKQLATIEGLTEEHGKNPVLLLSLGVLCMRNQLWGKARIYLESSIGAGPSTEGYRTLGGLLESMGDMEAALECYRKGMTLALEKSAG